MSGPLWMPLHVSDYIRDTRHLSTQETGAYLLLLMNAWTSNGELPADEKRLARIAGLTPKDWKRSREVLLDFLTLEGGFYRQKRIDVELKKAGELILKKSAAGKASARARAERALNGCSTGVATEGPTDGQQTGNQSQSQSSSKEEGAAAPKELSVFDRGVALLGGSPGSARSLIGKWRKAHGEEAVESALADAERLNISDPKSWITARLAKPANDRGALYESIERTFGGKGSK